MPDSSDNLDPKEATEAKLCAYLEGELPPEDRAEIEQYLANNPQHRQLLADLAKTREWMRSIPVEAAPSDIAEVFQGQVERAMLLDDSTSASRSSLNRWPQMLVMAAIVLMVIGLGVVIFGILRSPAGSSRTLSLAKSPSATTTESAPGGSPDKPAPEMITAAPTPTPTPVAAPILPAASATPTVVAAAAPPMSFAQTDKLMAPARDQVDASSADSVKAKLSNAGYHLPGDQKTVCFVISTDSPSTTANQVRGFFGRHELAFDDALTGKHESPGDALAQSTPQPILKGALADDTKNIGGNAPVQQNAMAQNMNDNAAQNQDRIAAIPATAPAETIYISRGFTPLQLELLSASLATDNLNQTFKRLTLAEASTTQPDRPGVGEIVKGQTISVTIPQLVGPGIDKTNVTKVADDGTISLPMIDPLPAAGTTADELQQRIATRYREANLIPQATVIVQIPTPVQPTTIPSTQPMAKMLASTQPTTVPTTQIVREEAGINVVVLIENSENSRK